MCIRELGSVIDGCRQMAYWLTTLLHAIDGHNECYRCHRTRPFMPIVGCVAQCRCLHSFTRLIVHVQWYDVLCLYNAFPPRLQAHSFGFHHIHSLGVFTCKTANHGVSHTAQTFDSHRQIHEITYYSSLKSANRKLDFSELKRSLFHIASRTFRCQTSFAQKPQHISSH